MKKLLTLLICVSLSLAFAFPAFASCDNNDQQPSGKTYISNLVGIGYDQLGSYSSTVSKAGLSTSNYHIVGGELGEKTDFNRGCGIGTEFIRLYKDVTTDPSQAIRGIIAVYKPYETGGSTSIKYNGCTYNVVGGAVKQGAQLDYTWYSLFSFNYHAGTCISDVFLYYTKDAKAGEPITDLKIYFDYENREQPNLVKEINQNCVCNFNEGCDKARMTFLQIIRDESNTASIFNDSTSVVFVIVGVVAILATGTVFVVTKKRKPKAQSDNK